MANIERLQKLYDVGTSLLENKDGTFDWNNWGPGILDKQPTCGTPSCYLGQYCFEIQDKIYGYDAAAEHFDIPEKDAVRLFQPARRRNLSWEPPPSSIPNSPAAYRMLKGRMKMVAKLIEDAAPKYDGHDKTTWEDCVWAPSPTVKILR